MRTWWLGGSISSSFDVSDLVQILLLLGPMQCSSSVGCEQSYGLPTSIPAGSQNLEGLEREIQKQNWKHRDKNRSSQVRLFRRGSNCGVVEEINRMEKSWTMCKMSKRKGPVLGVCIKTVSNITVLLLYHLLRETKKLSMLSTARSVKSQLTEVFQTTEWLISPHHLKSVSYQVPLFEESSHPTAQQSSPTSVMLSPEKQKQ